jgi:SSS family solute:Na+ symporter
MSFIDVVIVCLFLGITLVVGFRSSKRIKTLKEYAIGNRDFTDFVIFSTVIATVIGGNSTIGLIGQVHKIGVTQILAQLGTPISYAIIAFFVSGRIRQYYGCVSIGDILYKSYGIPGKIFGGIVSCCYESLNVCLPFMGMGIILNMFTNIPYVPCLLISGVIILLYTGRGGIRAVTFTDVLQFTVLIIAIPTLLSILLYHIGGVKVLFQSLPKSHLSINDANLHRYMLILWTFCLPSLSPTVTQRLLMTSSKGQGLRAYLGSGCVYFIVILIGTMIGLCARVLYPQLTNSDQALPMMMRQYLCAGMYGFVIAGFLAVFMSTVDSILNASSISLVNDLILPCMKRQVSEERKLIIARRVSFGLGAVAIFLAAKCEGLFETKILSRSLWFPLIVVPLYFALCNRKISKTGLFSSVLVGFVTVLLWNTYMKPTTKVDGLFPGFFANFIAFTLFYLFGGNSNIFSSQELAKIDQIEDERSRHLKKFDEKGFHIKTSYLLGVFLISTQILPLLFFCEYVTPDKVVLAVINGFIAMLLIFGPHLPGFYRKHFKICKYYGLVISFPVSSLYLVVRDSHCNGFYLLVFLMSLALNLILAEEKYRKWMKLTLMTLSISSCIAFVKMDLTFEFPESMRLAYGLYVFSFFVVMGILWFRMKMFILEKQKAVIEERYNLARNLSHDVVTPLTIVRLISKKLEKAVLSDEERRLLAKNTKEISGIIDSILPGVSKQYDNLSVENLGSIIRECIEQKKILHKHLRFRLEIREDVEARVDALLFLRLISNLINNSIEATQGTRSGAIVISVGKDILGNVQVSLRDNGCGIDLEQLYEVSRCEEQCEKYGLSIGLQEAREIIRSWHGRLELDSSQENGTNIVLLLPDKGHSQLTEEGIYTQEVIQARSTYDPKSASNFVLIDSDLDYQESCKMMAQVFGLTLNTYSTIDGVWKDLHCFDKRTCFFIEYVPNYEFNAIDCARDLYSKGYENLVIIASFLPEVPECSVVKKIISKDLPIFK